MLKKKVGERILLYEGFPPKIIKQFDKSIEELKLQESTLSQKIISFIFLCLFIFFI
jgi:hypothetical protein